MYFEINMTTLIVPGNTEVKLAMLLQSTTTSGPDSESRPIEEQRSRSPEKGTEPANTHILDYAPAPGWTTHVTKEGRLYYCK